MTKNPFIVNNPIRQPMCYQPSRPGMFSLPKTNSNSIFVNNYYGNMPGMDQYWANMYSNQWDKWDEAGQWIGVIGLGLGTIGEIFGMFKPDGNSTTTGGAS